MASRAASALAPAAQAGVQVVLDGAVLHDHQLGLQDGAVVLADQLGDVLAQAGDLVAGRAMASASRRRSPAGSSPRSGTVCRHSSKPSTT